MSRAARFLSLSGLSKLASLGAAASLAGDDVKPAPAAAAEGEDAPALPAGDYVLAADAVQLANTQGETAATAERARWNAVLSSDEGKANYAMAAFMLNANPTTSSADIVAHLATVPAAAVPPAPAAAAPAAVEPKIDLNGGKPAGAAVESGDKPKSGDDFNPFAHVTGLNSSLTDQSQPNGAPRSAAQ